MNSTAATIPVPSVPSEQLAVNPWIIAVTVTLATFTWLYPILLAA